MTIEDFKKLIPEYVITIAEELQKNNFEAFLVGGSTRDILLGEIPDDYDVATNAEPEAVMQIFEKSIPTGAKFGTITVIISDSNGENHDVQVTTYRSEADYVGGRWPSKVEFAKKIQDDLSRRDFTINAIALNLQEFDNPAWDVSGVLVDPFEGQKDLKERIIKAVGNPLERFTEDGLRSVRACRLASQLDFEIESNTFAAISQTLHITKLVSVERFRDELMKTLMNSPKPSKGLRLMKDCGILELFIPELLEGIGVVQPEFHSDDVFEHSIRTVDEAEDSVKLAALFHDIGKARKKTEDDKGIHFYGHDVEGAKMTEEIMRRLKFSNAEIDRTVKLVRWHMFYYPSADWRKENSLESLSEKNDLGWSDGAIRRLINNVGGEQNIDDLMKLRIADAAANPKNEFNPKELDALSERIAEVRAKEMALKVTDLDINGDDLKQELGIEGADIGRVLHHLLELVIDDPILNRKDELIKLAREFLEVKQN